MTSAASSKLFAPIRLGDKQLQHRVAMAPLTRFRSPKHVPMAAVAEYYGQRASPGGLLVTEATYISHEAGGMEGVPGIWNDEQIQAWKKVTAAVHAKEGVIYMQLWALGRANPGTADVPDVVSSTDVPLEGQKAPRMLNEEETKRYVKAYGQAAKNAIEAGFDGVEIHSANGYLLQQHINGDCNKRTDNYGGSVENRIRFTQEVVTEICNAIGEKKTSIRFSPWTSFQGMDTEDTDRVIDTYVKLCTWIHKQHPNFAAVHITEDSDVWRGEDTKTQPRSNDPFRAIFRHTSNTSEHTAEKIDNNNKPVDEKFPEPTKECPTLFISCGGYDADSAVKVADAKGSELIAIGRYFISNPDLPSRIKNGQSWTKYDRPTFYKQYSTDGYTDYAVYGKEGHGEKVKREKETAEAKL